MGANTFSEFGRGKDAGEAFKAAGGGQGIAYAGDITAKRSFVLLTPPEGVDPREWADSILDAGDSRVDDKWGPCGAVKVSEGLFYFFGWASS